MVLIGKNTRAHTTHYPIYLHSHRILSTSYIIPVKLQVACVSAKQKKFEMFKKGNEKVYQTVFIFIFLFVLFLPGFVEVKNVVAGFTV